MRNLRPYSWRKTMPDELQKPILKALMYYPELQTKHITFKYTRKVGTAIMKAQPVLKFMLRIGEERAYVIYVNRTLHLGQTHVPLHELPEEVLIGWFGHELGHVMDYESRSNWGMMAFGLGYLFSPSYMRKAENRADEFAIDHGMDHYLIKTKEFILNHADISEKYKRKIRKFYPSPEQIMELAHNKKTLSSLTT